MDNRYFKSTLSFALPSVSQCAFQVYRFLGGIEILYKTVQAQRGLRTLDDRHPCQPKKSPFVLQSRVSKHQMDKMNITDLVRLNLSFLHIGSLQ